MNRRMFLQASGTGMAVAVLTPATLFTTGCAPAQVVQDVEGVLTEGEAILTSAGQTAWATAFGDAVTALKTAYAVWDQSTTSTTGQKIDAILNALVAATAAILPNDPYAVLIDELVALAELALSFWTTSAKKLNRNPHIGAVPAPTSYKDAKQRWNTLAIGALAGARIA